MLEVSFLLSFRLWVGTQSSCLSLFSHEMKTQTFKSAVSAWVTLAHGAESCAPEEGVVEWSHYSISRRTVWGVRHVAVFCLSLSDVDRLYILG